MDRLLFALSKSAHLPQLETTLKAKKKSQVLWIASNSFNSGKRSVCKNFIFYFSKLYGIECLCPEAYALAPGLGRSSSSIQDVNVFLVSFMTWSFFLIKNFNVDVIAGVPLHPLCTSTLPHQLLPWSFTKLLSVFMGNATWSLWGKCVTIIRKIF